MAPAVARAIRISTERREPEQHKSGFSQRGRFWTSHVQCWSCQKERTQVCLKVGLKQTQRREVITPNDRLTENSGICCSPSELASRLQTLTLIVLITLLSWSTVNPSPPPPKHIHGASSVDPLDTLTFKALEPRLKQTINMHLFHRQSSRNCGEKKVKHRAEGWREEK